MKKGQTIAFAYYVDDNFIGWYADTFGSIRKTPKLYTHSKSQLRTIEKSFRSKMEKAKLPHEEKNFKKKYFALGPKELMTKMVGGQMSDYEKLNSGNKVELRIVKSPFYDGPNPAYSNKIYKKIRKFDTKMYHIWCKEMGYDPGIEPGKRIGIGRTKHYKEFEDTYSISKKTKFWIYADYEKVKIWAAMPPSKSKKFVKINYEPSSTVHDNNK